MSELRKLRGIGPRVEQWLHQAGIHSGQQLRELGAIEAYLRVIECTEFRANITLLYSLVGALENRNWTEVAQHDKARLLMELEGYAEWQHEH